MLIMGMGTGIGKAMDVEETRRIVVSLVQRNIGLFGGLRNLDRDDVVQHCMLQAWKEFPRWDPARASWSTHLYRAISCDIIDLARRSRKRNPEHGFEQLQEGDTKTDDPQFSRALPDIADAEDAAEWLREVYQRLARCMPERRRRGRRWFSRAQAASVALFMEQKKLSRRGAAELFRASGNFRAAIRLSHDPSPMWFSRAVRRCRGMLRRLDQAGGLRGPGQFVSECQPSVN